MQVQMSKSLEVSHLLLTFLESDLKTDYKDKLMILLL